MSKILIYSDLHIYKHKKSEDRLKECIRVLQWIFETATKNNIQDIVCVGDLFHDRQKIDVPTYQAAFEIFARYSNKFCRSWLLLGNHDMFHKNRWDVSSVIPLQSIQGVTVINEPRYTTVAGYPIFFLPYTENPVGDLRELVLQQPDCRKILFAHLAIDGAILNPHYQTLSDASVEHDGDMTKIDGVDIFQPWDRVFLGHYHAQQQLNDKVEYIGSPLQLSFGEAFCKKHIVIYDTETDEREYVENTFSPKHVICNENEDNNINQGDFVRIFVNDMGTTDTLDMKKLITETKKPASLELLPKPKVNQDKKTVDDSRALLMQINELIKFSINDEEYFKVLCKESGIDPTKLDKDILIRKAEEIIDEYQPTV